MLYLELALAPIHPAQKNGSRENDICAVGSVLLCPLPTAWLRRHRHRTQQPCGRSADNIAASYFIYASRHPHLDLFGWGRNLTVVLTAWSPPPLTTQITRLTRPQCDSMLHATHALSSLPATLC
jgi:hypothetical protein